MNFRISDFGFWIANFPQHILLDTGPAAKKFGIRNSEFGISVPLLFQISLKTTVFEIRNSKFEILAVC